MTRTLKIALTETEMKLLLEQSTLNCRRPHDQARFLLRSCLLSDNQAAAINANSDVIRQDSNVAVRA